MDNSTYVSAISFDIETWKRQGLTDEEIIKEINLKTENEEDKLNKPRNLEYISSFAAANGQSGCAFKDKNTGEAIIGFAGTNSTTNEKYDPDLIQDILTDISIPFNAPDTTPCDNFVVKIKDMGYYVAEVTGESLGGNLAMRTGVNNGIDNIVLYDPAPPQGYAGSDLSIMEKLTIGNLGILGYIIAKSRLPGKETYNDKYEQYDGNVTIFACENDWLTPTMQKIGLKYPEPIYTIHNTFGHGMYGFYSSEETTNYIETVLKIKRNDFKYKTGIREFNLDGKVIQINDKDFQPMNLLDTNRSVKDIIKLTPETFYELNASIKQIQNNELCSIENINNRCLKINKEKGDKYEVRLETLCHDVLTSLEHCELYKLMETMEDSYGKLEEDRGKLDELSELDIDYVFGRIDKSMADKEMSDLVWEVNKSNWWEVEQEEEEEVRKNVDKSVKRIRKCSIEIKKNLVKAEHISNPKRGGRGYISSPTLEFNKRARVTDLFVNLTKELERNIEEVFKGTTLSETKNDAIVQSLNNIFEEESIDMEEFKKVLNTLAEFSVTIGKNFETLDKYLAEEIEKGNNINAEHKINVADNYFEFVESRKVVSDINILQTMKNRVSEKTVTLSDEIEGKYRDFMDKYELNCVDILSELRELKQEINILNRYLESTVYAKTYEVGVQHETEGGYKKIPWEGNPNFNVMQYYLDSEPMLIKYWKNNVNTLIDEFEYSANFMEIFLNNTEDLKSVLYRVVELAIYGAIDLEGIVESQRVVIEYLMKIERELELAANNIEIEAFGESIAVFVEKMRKSVQLANYIQVMLQECFG